MDTKDFKFQNENLMNLYIQFMSAALNGVLSGDADGALSNEACVASADQVAVMAVKKFLTHVPKNTPTAAND